MQECNHTQLNVVYIEDTKGNVQLEICKNPKCAKIIRVICEHVKNTWKYTRNQADPEEQYLACNLCGSDGT